MTNDTYERAGLNTYRFIAGFAGQFVVTGLALTLANSSEAVTKRKDSIHSYTICYAESGFLLYYL